METKRWKSAWPGDCSMVLPLRFNLTSDASICNGGKESKTVVVLVVFIGSIVDLIEDRIKGILSRNVANGGSVGMKDNVAAELVIA